MKCPYKCGLMTAPAFSGANSISTSAARMSREAARAPSPVQAADLRNVRRRILGDSSCFVFIETAEKRKYNQARWLISSDVCHLVKSIAAKVRTEVRIKSRIVLTTLVAGLAGHIPGTPTTKVITAVQAFIVSRHSFTNATSPLERLHLEDLEQNATQDV